MDRNHYHSRHGAEQHARKEHQHAGRTQHRERSAMSESQGADFRTFVDYNHGREHDSPKIGVAREVDIRKSRTYAQHVGGERQRAHTHTGAKREYKFRPDVQPESRHHPDNSRDYGRGYEQQQRPKIETNLDMGRDVDYNWMDRTGIDMDVPGRVNDGPKIDTTLEMGRDVDYNWMDNNGVDMDRTGRVQDHPIGFVTEKHLGDSPHSVGLVKNLHGGSSSYDQVRSNVISPRLETGAIIGIAVGGAVLLFCILGCVAGRSKTKKKEARLLLDVFKYLVVFRLDDVDIRVSPAGGFHVNYENELKQGVNESSSPDTSQKDSDSNKSDTELSKEI